MKNIIKKEVSNNELHSHVFILVSVSSVRNESNFCIVVVVVVVMEMVMTAIFDAIHCQVDRKIPHGSNGIVQPIYKMTFTLVPFAVTSMVDLSKAKC